MLCFENISKIGNNKEKSDTLYTADRGYQYCCQAILIQKHLNKET